jgi:hypothetical protein
MKGQRGMLTLALLSLMALAGQRIEAPAQGQAIGFEPIPAPLPSGVILDVTPSVSADRRYVRLSLGVNFTDIQGFTTYQVPAAVSGGGPVGMNGLLGGIGGVGGLGGVGGGAGGRAAGLAGPIAAAPDPGFGFDMPSGDPFEQALKTQPEVRPAPGPLPARVEKRPSRPGSAHAKVGQSPRRGPVRPQHAATNRKKYRGHSATGSFDGVMPEEPDGSPHFNP